MKQMTCTARTRTTSRCSVYVFMPTLLFVMVGIDFVDGFIRPSPCHSTIAKIWPSTLFIGALDVETATERPPVSSGAGSATSGASSPQQGYEPNDFDHCFPGRDENSKFDCDDSVGFWRNFQTTESAPLDENVRAMSQVATRFLTTGPNGGAYFAKHFARSGYFVVNALFGNAAFQLHERLFGGGTGPSSGATGKGGFALLPIGLSGDIASRILLEAFLSYEQDYEWIQRGTYREPWDMTLGNRQSSPAYVLTQTGRFMRESVGALSRRNRATDKDRQVAFFGTGTSASAFYPKYYQNAFHYQTDGWMSPDSANVYETSTETLFVGRQDSMQRTSLPPIMALSESIQKERRGRPMRVLEVACGTGRVMTFVRDNLPLDAEYTALDLSPFYLEKARDNDDYWRKWRLQEEQRQGNNEIKDIAPATLVQAQAEQLPFEDGVFDAVVCVYLFHELPREVRARAAAEMARVLAPGGTVVLTDSIQRGDRPGLDDSLGNFEGFNEPYYRDYLADELGMHFERHGLKPMTKITRSTTKSLSFGKPSKQ